MSNNKGIPLMKLISNTFTLIIATCDNIQELESIVNQYHDFLMFVIISTTNMKFNERERKRYEEVHNLAKNTIFFGMSFLIQQIFERKGNNTFFFKCLRSLFFLCFKIYYNVQTMINDKQKEGKGILSFNWFKSKSGNDLSNCAVYLLFKECFENESALQKIFYLRIRELKQSWDLKPVIGWVAVRNQLAMYEPLCKRIRVHLPQWC